jgi:hypothetical protein
MTDSTNDQDVNTGDGEDRVTDDHDAGLGSSAEDMETHNPDIADFDKVISEMDAQDDDADDSSGGTINTDDSGADDAAASDADDKDDKKDDKDEANIPRTRLNEVIEREKLTIASHHERELEWTRKEAILEGRLAALEKPVAEVASEPDPLDTILAGEPQQVLDAFTSDPTGFVNMIKAATRAETTIDINTKREDERYQANLTTELDKFKAERDDFMSSAPKLMEIMDSNPIHNAISAYAYEIEIPALAAKLETATKDMDTKIADAKAEGIVEGKKLAIKEIQVKGSASVLDGSSASQSGAKANAGAHLETGGDGTKLREKLTAELLAKRAAAG